MQHQYAQAIELSNILTMEEVLNGRLHLEQRSFSSENRILQEVITEKPSSSKRNESYKESRISPQQVPLQTFQWSSPEISQEYRPNAENIIKFENDINISNNITLLESPVISMDGIYYNSSRNKGNNVSKKFYTVPYSFHFHHNTFPTTRQFSENRFPQLENDIQTTTLFVDESKFTDKSKDYVTTIFPISIDEGDKNSAQNGNQTESKILANNIDYMNKIGIFDSEYRIKKEKPNEKQQRSVKESLAAESLVTLQISKEENEVLPLSKDQRTQNKQTEKIKQKEQNRADKENDQKLNTKNILHDQILYDMFIKSGLTMEDVLKFREDHYKNPKNDTVLHPATISMQSQTPTTINIPMQLQAPVPVPNPFQSPAPIVNSMKVKLPKTKPANIPGYRSKPIPILPATNLPYHPYIIQESEVELNTEINDNVQEKPQRPGYSYASMIGQAITASPEKKLALADIYSWISKTYPYYKMSDVGWKNSIRHNLSLYSAFVRIPNEGTTRSLWMINPEEEQCFIDGVYHYSKRPPGSNKNLRRKSRPVSKVVNENLNNNAQTACIATNDTIMPMVTSLSYCSVNPIEYFTNQYNVQSTCKLLKDEALSEKSDSTVTSD